MTREETLHILSEHWDELQGFGVESIAIFGSVARDEAGTGSDIDLLVELDAGEQIGLFKFLELKERLENVLCSRVDLVTREGLKPRLREKIIGEAVAAN